MPDPRDSEPHRPPGWDELQNTIHWWLVARFGLNSPRDKDIWLFCIGAAMHLERMAVGVLWVDDERPVPLYEYRSTMTLGQANHEIKKRGLLDDATRTILKGVADLRNSVAHRHAIFVTAPSPIEGQAFGKYNGHQIFMDRQALDELTRDIDNAAQAMWDWIAAKAPDLAEQARRGEQRDDAAGAHPTPP